MSGQEEGLIRRPGVGNSNDVTSFDVVIATLHSPCDLH